MISQAHLGVLGLVSSYYPVVRERLLLELPLRAQSRSRALFFAPRRESEPDDIR